MLRFVWSHLRGRLSRSIALLVGILVATTGFTVLTGTTETARLRITGTLDANSRGAYDILVRPKDARSPLETERGLVRPNHTSGLFGGISHAQYEQVRNIPGVGLAAPIAMVGYTMVTVPIPFDITDAVDRTVHQQVIRLDPTLIADRGMTRWADAPSYVYVTRNELLLEQSGPKVQVACGSGLESGRPYELLPDGRRVRVCDTGEPEAVSGDGKANANGLTPAQRTSLQAFQLTAAGTFRAAVRGRDADPQERLIVYLPLTVPFLLAGVDPAAEAELAGLEKAVVAGEYLSAAARPLAGAAAIPVIVTAKPYVDQQVAVRYSRVDGSDVAGTETTQLRERLMHRRGAAIGQARQDVAMAYQRTVSEAVAAGGARLGQMNLMIRAGAPTYDVAPDGTLTVQERAPDLSAYRSGQYAGLSMPGLAIDSGARPLNQRLIKAGSRGLVTATPVGLYDPDKLTGFSALTQVPLETYQAPTATGADSHNRELLGDRPLLPNGNPAGYLAAPPFMLMDLARYADLGEPPDPISVIRVRVKGVDGYGDVAAERVRRTAEQIALATGLDVDITFGSSPTEQAVVLPASTLDRPELRLTELWSRKGVASVIVQAVDRKSLVLFGLILVVCLLFLANAVAAAVRDRQRELAILACLGWPARRIAALILGEVAMLGLTAGMLSLLLALPLGAAVGVRISLGHAALAIPVGLVLAMLAGLAPALRAARAHPASALRPSVMPARRARRHRGIFSLAVTNLARVPGRTLLGALSLAVGACALTLLTAVQWAFNGDVQGSLLGNAISVTVRGVDVAAGIATILLGLLGVADVIYLNIRDRAAEFAALRVTGWSEPALGRLVVYEGLGLGLLGAVAGAATGLGAAAFFVGEVRPPLVLAALAIAVVGVVVTALAAMVPTLWLRRLPTRALLAEE